MTQVLYLNLARRPDRDEQFLQTNRGCADFRRIEAVDGTRLARDEMSREGMVAEPRVAYTPGALGTALSHKRIWEHCASVDHPVTVAEDDAIFNRGFSEKATSLLADLPADWDIILWGWNFDSILRAEIIPGVKQTIILSDPRPLGPRTADFQQSRHDVVAMRLLNAFGTVCYSVSPKGSRRLGERCFPLRDERIVIPGLGRKVRNSGIDVVMNKVYRQLKSHVCFPPLVWTENDKAASDVSRMP